MKPNASRRLGPWSGGARATGRMLVLVLGLAVGLSAAPPAAAIRIGPPKPVCPTEEPIPLEGSMYIEVVPVGGAPEYTPVRTGRSDPVMLDEGESYRLGLRMGEGGDAPVIPARYRVESRSFLTLSAHGAGEDGFPLSREYSWNAYRQILVYARNAGRRLLFLRVSECYAGGSRYLYAPFETVVPVVVRPGQSRSGSR